MKKRLNELCLSVILFACALCGCDAKVDLDNIDPSAKVEMGLALPVGEFTITLGDLLKTDNGMLSVNEQGVYELKTNMSIEQEIEDIDISQYSATSQKTLFISDKVGNLPVIMGPIELPIEFEVKMGLEGMNQELQEQRIDSMVLTQATINANISQNFGLSTENVKNVELVLSDDFRRPEGQTITLPFTGFNKNIPISLTNFCIRLLDDPTLPAGNDNVKDTISMTLRLTLKLNADETVSISSGSKFVVNTTVRINDYEAIYGNFLGSTPVGFSGNYSMNELWEGFSSLKELNLNLYDPRIAIDLTTTIAAGIRFNVNELSTENANHANKVKANFNGKDSYSVSLPNYVKVTDLYTATATNTIVFDRANGNIGKLFTNNPAYLNFDMGIQAEPRDGSDQQRIVKGNNRFAADVNMQLPFNFDQGSSILYTDTAAVDFSTLNLDSVLQETGVMDSLRIHDLHLVLAAINELPMTVDLEFAFLDANKQDLHIQPTDEGNTLHLPSTLAQSSNGPANIDIRVNDEKMSKLKDVRHLVYKVRAQDPNPQTYPVSLKPENGLKIQIAFSADVAAYLNLMFNQNGSEE